MTQKSILTTTYNNYGLNLYLGQLDDALCLCVFDNERSRGNLQQLRTKYRLETKECESRLLFEAKAQLDEYLCHRRTAFDIKLLKTGSPFALAVLDAVSTLAYGTCASYGDIARIVATAAHARAVASVLRHNTLNIFIPCHRVISCNARPGGYQGGEMIKNFLLKLEHESLVNLQNMP